MVLGILAPGSAGQHADGQVEAGRTVLAFVVAEGEEVLGHKFLAEFGQARHNGQVDFGVPAAALLVVEGARVAQVRGDQAVAEGAEPVAVPGQPGDRADAAGGEQEAVAAAALGHGGQGFGEMDGDGDAGEVVVRQLGMADVARDDDLFGGRPRQQALSPGHRTVFERGVDEDLVLAVREGFKELVGQTEAPRLLVVRGAVGDQVRLLRQAVEAESQVAQRKPAVDRDAVADQVQAVVGEVDDPTARRVPDPRLARVPLSRHGPVEDGRAGGEFVGLQWDPAADPLQGGPNAVARQAARDGVELSGEVHHRAADRVAVEGGKDLPDGGHGPILREAV